MAKIDLQPLFDALVAVVEPYAKHFNWGERRTDYWDLWLDLEHSRTLFAAVAKMRGKVAFHLYPLALWTKLRDRIPPSLERRAHGKYRFDFDAIDARTLASLSKLTATAYARWDEETARGTKTPIRSRR